MLNEEDPVPGLTGQISTFNSRVGITHDDVRAASNTDEVVEVFPVGDLSRFVHPLTGEIIARMKWESPSFTDTPFNWSSDLDQAVWFIEQDSF